MRDLALDDVASTRTLGTMWRMMRSLSGCRSLASVLNPSLALQPGVIDSPIRHLNPEQYWRERESYEVRGGEDLV